MITIKELHGQEYKYEVGGSLGIASYMGDANRSNLNSQPGPVGGALFRYNINFLWGVKLNLLVGSVSGDTNHSNQKFPYGMQSSFRRTFVDVGTQIEFNFFPYSDKYAYLGTKPYTPYLFTGVGATGATGNNSFLDANIPLGMGFKFKLKNRVNIGIEFSMRKLFRDDFDVTEKKPEWSLDTPYGIKSSILKNRDWYSVTMIFLTWDFNLREDPCHGN